MGESKQQVGSGHLRSIEMRNMRSFERAKFNLANCRVVVAIGNSNEGKSNIVRGIMDVLTNRSGVDAFTRHGTSVGAMAIDEVALTKGKEKSKVINRYSVADPSDTSGWRHWESVGKGAPDEVLGVLNMQPIEFDDGFAELLNVAEQRGAQFFVDYSPSQRAKVIGSICGLAEIYAAVREAVSDERKAKGEIKAVEKAVEAATASLREFDDAWAVEDLKAVAANLADRAAKLDKATKLVESLRQRVTQWLLVGSQIQTVQGRIDAWRQLVNRCGERIKQVAADGAELYAVKLLVNEWQRVQISRDRTKRRLQLSARFVRLHDRADTVSKAAVMVTALGMKVDNWRKSQQQLQRLRNAIADGRTQLQTKRDDLHHANQKLTICPQCGQSLTSEAKERLLHGHNRI